MPGRPWKSRHIALAMLAMVGTACSGQAAPSQSAPAPSVPAPTASVRATQEATATPVATASPTPAVTIVTIAELSFGPPEITVAPGELTFVNADIVPHTVTEGQNGAAAPQARFDTLIPVGETIVITLSEAGDVFITCQFHAEMSVLVHVR